VKILTKKLYYLSLLKIREDVIEDHKLRELLITDLNSLKHLTQNIIVHSQKEKIDLVKDTLLIVVKQNV
jgi:hypothetical protein